MAKNRIEHVNTTLRKRKDKNFMQGHENFYVIEGGLSGHAEIKTHLLFIKDNKVCFQNSHSQQWGNILGESLCNHCVVVPCSPDDCAFKMSAKYKKRVDIFKYIKNIFYRVTSIPMHVKGSDYYLVAATQAKETLNQSSAAIGNKIK